MIHLGPPRVGLIDIFPEKLPPYSMGGPPIILYYQTPPDPPFLVLDKKDRNGGVTFQKWRPPLGGYIAIWA